MTRKPKGTRLPKPVFGHHFLKEWREKRGMTLEQVGEAVGLSHAQLSRIERRQQKYNQELLEKLAKLYKATPGALIERDPQREEAWLDIERYTEFVLSRGH
jgi:transcriptional regulator with XRE-family HTH domain